ncbi:MAG: carbon storage regulator [Planctomycetia bacterium]|nr:carbon storage regulator [Planctomycetia bacterium]
MLVLTRKLGEAIRIGNDVEVFVVGVSRGKVKLGFKAARNVAVQRSEIAPREPAPVAAAEPASRLIPLAKRELAGNPPLRAFRTASGV